MSNSKYAAVFLTAINQDAISSRDKQIEKISIDINLFSHGSNNLNLIVRNKSEKLDVKNAKPIDYINLINPTRGALISLSFALDKIPSDMPILVIPTNSWVNFDSKLFVTEMIKSGSRIGLVCFESNNPNYSYLRKKGKQVVEFREKEIIGDLATAGVFYFASKQDIASCIEWCLLNNIHKNGNYYLAPSLNYFICQDSRIGLHEINASSYYRAESELDIQIIKKESKIANI
jgi:UDP-N-acetylglucosamine diphosphorylase / glucose-1-phosphate thymidylyltransferase / UDP-N-acetylgalactosamine diphosphorylase / glucosamine-1-phosphate N-acetyltransferase / galactosamine-1-phosphate N-acetyltransferase